MMLNSIRLRGVVGMVGMVVGVGGRRREGLMEWKGGVLTISVLCVVPRRIDVVCMADRGLPSSRCARGVGIRVRGRWVVRSISAISGAVESIV